MKKKIKSKTLWAQAILFVMGLGFLADGLIVHSGHLPQAWLPWIVVTAAAINAYLRLRTTEGLE